MYNRKGTLTSENPQNVGMGASKVGSGGNLKSALKIGSAQGGRNDGLKSSNEDSREIGGHQEKKKVNKADPNNPNSGADFFKDVIHEIKREERKFKKAEHLRKETEELVYGNIEK